MAELDAPARKNLRVRGYQIVAALSVAAAAALFVVAVVRQELVLYAAAMLGVCVFGSLPVIINRGK